MAQTNVRVLAINSRGSVRLTDGRREGLTVEVRTSSGRGWIGMANEQNGENLYQFYKHYAGEELQFDIEAYKAKRGAK